MYRDCSNKVRIKYVIYNRCHLKIYIPSKIDSESTIHTIQRSKVSLVMYTYSINIPFVDCTFHSYDTKSQINGASKSTTNAMIVRNKAVRTDQIHYLGHQLTYDLTVK